MRCLTAAIVGALVLFSGTSGASEARRPARGTLSCVPGHAFLIVADQRAQVYEEEAGISASILGCVYGHRRLSYLGSAYEPPPANNGPGVGSHQFALAGTDVVQEEADGRWWVVVRNLLTGQVLHRIPAITSNPVYSFPEGGVSNVYVHPVVAANGAAAWIASTNQESGSQTEVLAVDKTGTRLLASGDGVDRNSLTLVDSTLYWTQNGRSRSAHLATGSTSKARHLQGASNCTPGHAFQIIADEEAQVYGEEPRGGAKPKRFGCAYGHHGVYRLGEQSELGVGETLAASVYRQYAISGKIVAYEESHRGQGANIFKEGAHWLIVVRDLRTGRVLHRVPTGVAPRSVPFVGVGEAQKIVVKSDGAAAWITNNYDRGIHCRCTFAEVRAIDRYGSRLLASGKNKIEASSLALVGSNVYWTQNGRAHSAALN
jgi:hypothetical protein